MKKSFLLLLFLACTLVVSARDGSVNTPDPVNPVHDLINAAPEQGCLICASCGGMTVCASASNCSKAGNLLPALLESMGCLTSED